MIFKFTSRKRKLKLKTACGESGLNPTGRMVSTPGRWASFRPNPPESPVGFYETDDPQEAAFICSGNYFPQNYWASTEDLQNPAIAMAALPKDVLKDIRDGKTTYEEVLAEKAPEPVAEGAPAPEPPKKRGPGRPRKEPQPVG